MREQDKDSYVPLDQLVEWVRHPDILEYQILLNSWERAYVDMHKYGTPDYREKFMRIDSWVKTITLHIREINSQIE